MEPRFPQRIPTRLVSRFMCVRSILTSSRSPSKKKATLAIFSQFPRTLSKWRTLQLRLRRMLCRIRFPIFRLAVFLSFCSVSQLLDSPSFRVAFGDKIPPGFSRRSLSSFTQELKVKTEAKLFSTLRDRDVFLLVDGGTLNRKRLLNVCVGSEGWSYFHRSIRVANLTAEQVCFSGETSST